MRPNAFRFVLPLGCAVLAGATLPGAAAAQSDFLFRPPVITIGVRAGPMLYSANGDVFDDVTTNLQRRDGRALKRGDFRAPALGVEFVAMPTSRLDIALGFMWAQTETDSEFRDWVDQDDLPIEQVTRLRTIPVTATVRYLLLPRGRRISQLAWLPRTTVPYVGAGAGVTWYSFEQEGDFVDIEDLDIFADELITRGEQVTFHALAGVDHWLTSRVGVNAEARYTRGSANPDQSFSSYDALDLGGLQATLGLSFRW